MRLPDQAIPAAEAVSLLDPDRPERAVAWHQGKAISQASLLHEAQRLAERLPERSHVVNDCRGRRAFMAAFLAAILRRQVTVLPNERTRRVAEALRVRFPGLYGLSDRPGDFEGLEVMEVSRGEGAVPAAASAPSVPADRVVAMVFTSGSTGQPQPNEKTLGALAATASRIAKRFELGPEPPAAVVATVPPQHMYGLETSVSLPLWGPVSVHDGRPFYPADIAAALAEVPAPRILVTTPIHLRALAAAKIDLPEIQKVISATAPLSDRLAYEIERRLHTEVHEIYGFSEASAVATRRTVAGPTWLACDGMTLRQAGGRCYVEAPHVGAVPMNDIVDLVTPQQFLLRGRMADLVNVAGKRTSLSGLNAVLAEIDGVADGAFFAEDPDEDTEVGRLTAFVVAPGRSAKDIRAALRREIDAAFVPRKIHLVPALPRGESGKLSREALRDLARQCAKGRR